MKVTLLPRDTYLALIKNSLGARIFKALYAEVGGRKKNILQGGILSCPFFVSSILLLMNMKLIQEPHATVEGTIQDMKHCGWKAVRALNIGSIIVWEEKRGHKHIGFYIGGRKAVSNSTKQKVPKIHHVTYGVRNNEPVRKIEAVYWHKKFEK